MSLKGTMASSSVENLVEDASTELKMNLRVRMTDGAIEMLCHG